MDPTAIYISTEHDIEYLVLRLKSSFVMCKLGKRRKHMKLCVVNARIHNLVENVIFQDKKVIGTFNRVSESKVQVFYGDYANPDSALKALHVSLIKFCKSNDAKLLDNYDDIVSGIKEIMDKIACRCNIRDHYDLLHEVLKKHKQLPMLNRNIHAFIIQNAWRIAISNPSTKICKQRLMREFESLNA